MTSNMHSIPKLDRVGLRNFGITTGSILAVLFGLFFPWLLDNPVPAWPWIVAGALVLWALLLPLSLQPVYRGWMRFGLFMSGITTPLILGIVFFIIITPMALILALCKRDPLVRKSDASTESYRVRNQQAGNSTTRNLCSTGCFLKNYSYRYSYRF